MSRRTARLSRERILRTALKLVDAKCPEALSMRNIADALHAGTMSLYNHVSNKGEVLEGLVDLVAREFPTPQGDDWKRALRASCIGSYEALVRHPWCCRLIVSSPSVGPTRLAYYDAVLGTLRSAGFSIAEARRAFLSLEVIVLGFALQQASIPAGGDHPEVVTREIRDTLPSAVYPNLVAMLDHVIEAREYVYPFELALDVLLDGLGKLRDGPG